MNEPSDRSGVVTKADPTVCHSHPQTASRSADVEDSYLAAFRTEHLARHDRLDQLGGASGGVR
jgi:hypothetical protein